MDYYIQTPDSKGIDIQSNLNLLSVYPADASPGAIEMVGNVVKACGLTEGSQAQNLPLSSDTALVRQILAANVSHVVVYGLTPKQLGAQFQVKPYQWVKLGGTAWCFAERPELINNDMARKKRLWSSLKLLKTA